MSLTQTDLQQIRGLFEEYTKPLEGRLIALDNDVKEIYHMILGLQRSSITDKDFRKKPAKERILILHAEVVAAAKELGVELPKP